MIPRPWYDIARPKQLPPDHPRHSRPDGNPDCPYSADGYYCRWIDKDGKEHRCHGQDDWYIWLMLAGRGAGKRLDSDTLIPVPEGWKRLGNLKPGDHVFDHAGNPVRVLAVYDGTPAVAYRLTFSDGSILDADADHLWATWTHSDRKQYLREKNRSFPADWPSWRGSSGHGPRIRTTKEIAATTGVGLRSDTNHCIPVCGALNLPDRDLLIDPYVLGVWLGDGSKHGAQITIGDDDAPGMLANLAACGVEVTGPPQRKPDAKCASYPVDGRGSRTCGKRDSVTGRFLSSGGLRSKLAEMDLLLNKHVPLVYLRGSAEQRLALLQGLMDSDGGWSAMGRQSVEFSSTTENLALAVTELARSLGQKATIHESRAKIHGKDCGPKWRVFWTPTINVFRLPRKANRFIPTLNGRDGRPQGLRNNHRMIKSAELIDPKPMRCITVESEHGLFLAGEAMIPTHNTLAGSNWILEQALKYPETRWAVVAPAYSQVTDVCFTGNSGIMGQALPGEIVDYNKNNLIITLTNGSQIYGFSTETPNRIRGFNLSGAWLDEAGYYRDTDMWDEVLQPALRVGQPKVIVTTTPSASPLLKRWHEEFIEKNKHGDRCDIHLTTAPVWENTALPEAQLRRYKEQYAGTRIGRQEMEGEMLEDFEGALWKREFIEKARIRPEDFDIDKMIRIVVAVDPSMTSGEKSDENGIIVAGVDNDKQLYLIADLSCRGTPEHTMRAAVDAYYKFGADCVVMEENQGGDYLMSALRAADPGVPPKKVRAQKGKLIRAQPISMLAEQGRIHHVGFFKELEDQLCIMTPDNKRERDDRADAFVWAFSALRPDATDGSYLDVYGMHKCENCQYTYNKSYGKCPKCNFKPREEKPAAPGDWAKAYKNTCRKCGIVYPQREPQCPNCHQNPGAYLAKVSQLNQGKGNWINYQPRNFLR